MAKPLGTPAVLEDLGEKITAARGKRLQVEIAKASGIDISTISDLENGRRNPSYTTLLGLAAALGVALPDLLRGGQDSAATSDRALEKRVISLEKAIRKFTTTPPAKRKKTPAKRR